MATEGNELCDAIGSLAIREKWNALYKEGNIAEGGLIRSGQLEYATRISNSCQSLYQSVNSGSS